MAELVTIAEYSNVNEAYVFKSRLESEGIKTYLLNENLNTILPGGSFSVKLQVNLHDSFRAMDILFEED